MLVCSVREDTETEILRSTEKLLFTTQGKRLPQICGALKTLDTHQLRPGRGHVPYHAKPLKAGAVQTLQLPLACC